ncbi:hypothetical protein BGX27_008905 [Mortierella sp. AM989]|nr:hypothetical protein BGX27_008905 [Mortierella sp. AM989]
MPSTPPSEARRGSLRSRNAASATNTQSNLTSNSSKPGTIAQTRAQHQSLQDSQQSRGIAGSASTLSTPGRPGRPRKEVISVLIEDIDKSRKSRGKLSKTRESTVEPSTSPTSGSPSIEQEARLSRPPTKDTHMDVDKEGLETHSQLSRRSNSIRNNTRQSTSTSKEVHQPFGNNSGDNSSSSGSSEAPDQRKDRAQPNQDGQDRGTEDASSDSGDDDGDDGSDEDHQERGITKGKRQKTATVPSRRRLRSSKLIPSVVAHLAADSDGLTIDQILDEYTEEQQVLRANAGAAEALTRLLRRAIQDSESLHPDLVDAQDYELIRHTFGEIEDLNLNLTGTLTAPDESSGEDDDLTRDLKRKHRRAKRVLLDISAKYKAVKRSMTIKLSADLDKEEAQIKDGTHPDLLAELKAIEERRQARIKVVKAQRDYCQQMWEVNFQAVCKAADDQYHAGKVSARRNIKDMVQYRMNRIKQELAQHKRASSKSSRRLIYVNAVEANGYESCGESCSSYDSYSSSGSECSDCEICRPPRHLQIPQLRSPKGLTRREVALDLSFLFPESGTGGSRRQPPDNFGSSRSLLRRTRQYSSDGEDSSYRQSNSRNQQYMIDHLNDERRRKRRVLDRELQSRAAYKIHPVGEREGKTGGHDMDIDQDQELEHLERGVLGVQSIGEPSSRSHSPTQSRGNAQLASQRSHSKDYRPRFLPGFGPDGMESSKRYVESLMDPRLASKYSAFDRYSRPLDRSRSGATDKLKANHDDAHLYPNMERESTRMRGVRAMREAYSPERDGNQHEQYYAQQYLNQYEPRDAIYHSRKHVHRTSASNPAEDVYPFDNDKKPRHSIPKSKLTPYPPPSKDGTGYHNPRGRPLKSSQILLPWVEPVVRQGHAAEPSSLTSSRPSASPITDPRYDGHTSPTPVNGVSPRNPSVVRYDTSRPREEPYLENHNSSARSKAPHSHRRIDEPIQERQGSKYPSNPIPSPSYIRKTGSMHPPMPYYPRSSHLPPHSQRPPISPDMVRLSGSSTMAFQQQQRYQQQQQQRLAMQRTLSSAPAERPAPIIIDLSSPPASPKQEPAKASSVTAPASTTPFPAAAAEVITVTPVVTETITATATTTTTASTAPNTSKVETAVKPAASVAAATNATTEPTTGPIAEVTTELTTEPTAEVTTEHITEATVEATTEATTEATVEATTEAATEATTEATTTPTHEPANGRENDVVPEAEVSQPQSPPQDFGGSPPTNGISSNGTNTATEVTTVTLEKSITPLAEASTNALIAKDKPSLAQKNEDVSTIDKE